MSAPTFARAILATVALATASLTVGCIAEADGGDELADDQDTDATSLAMSANLLTNGGFENGWKHWALIGEYYGAQFKLLGATGTYARIVDPNNDAIARICHYDTPVVAGKKYLFQAKTRRHSGTGVQQFHIIFYDVGSGGGSMPVGTPTSKSMGAGSDWHWASVSIVAPPKANQVVVCLGDTFGTIDAATYDYDGVGIYRY